MKFALKFAVVALVYSLVLAAYAQEKKEEPAAEAPKDVEGVIRRVIEGVKPGAPAATKPGEKKKEEEAVEVTRAPVVELGPKFIRLHLQDGSVISGDLSVTEVTVETQFGKLTVPISKIRSFTPGLDSNKKAAENIKSLVEKLGGDDYKTREQAHKDLAALGIRVQKELEKHVGSDNAELKRHVSEILKEMEEATEEAADDDTGSIASPWIALDTIVTTDFTVLGKVTPQDFTIASKYGPLNIALGDITKAERETAARESYKKNMSVGGDTLAQRGFKSSGIKVQAGDKIIVKAEGSIVMSPWGSNAHSGPDGMPNYGWYIPNQIAGGALCAKIGDKGQPFKVGRSFTMVAKTSGTLMFAIGIQGEYAGEGYQFPGEYKLKVRVDPK